MEQTLMQLIALIYSVGGILSLFLGRFINIPTGMLYCGLFGFSGRKDRRVDPKKILILGLYNRTRGTDSCGYYYNGNIVKGTGQKSDFKDFAVDNRFISGELPFETLMCHTRKSTYGQHTEENAHPHKVGNLVQTHNGTITNTWDMCTKHGISHTNLHLDSIGLATIIQKDGFGVLNEYEGHAALTMVFVDDPASLYLYHGASRQKKDEASYEERPLFTLETVEGLYYSSMPEALKMINSGKNKPEMLPHNAVFQIQHGEIIKNIYDVKREDVNLPKVYVYNKTIKNYSTVDDNEDDYRATAPFYSPQGSLLNSRFNKQSNAAKRHAQSELVFSGGDAKNRSTILQELPPPEFASSEVYYRYGRHHRTEFVEVGDKQYEQREILLNGSYLIDRTGAILKLASHSGSKSEIYYFVRGVMMRDYKAYKTLIDNDLTWKNKELNICQTFSRYSKYPVTSYLDESTSICNSVRNTWFYDNARYDGEVDCKFTKRKYVIHGGYLVSTKRSLGSPDPFEQAKITDIDFKRKVYVDGEEDPVTTAPTYESIFEIIETHADRIIKGDEMETLPECFLLFIEQYIEDKSRISLNERQLFNQTVMFMTELIMTKKTLLEIFETNKEHSDFFCVDVVKEYFKDYPPQDIIDMVNRYTLQSFEIVDEVIPSTTDICVLPEQKKQNNMLPVKVDTLPEGDGLTEQELLLKEQEIQEYKIRIKKFETQMAELKKTADELQELSTVDEAQTVAYNVYMLDTAITSKTELVKKPIN